jgi:hypothetical protein
MIDLRDAGRDIHFEWQLNVFDERKKNDIRHDLPSTKTIRDEFHIIFLKAAF